MIYNEMYTIVASNAVYGMQHIADLQLYQVPDAACSPAVMSIFIVWMFAETRWMVPVLYVIHVIISSKKHSTSLHPDTSWYQNNCFSTSFKIAWAESPRALRHLTWSCVGQLVHSPQTVTFRAFINPFMVGWWQSNSCSSWSSWVYLGTQSHSALEALVQCDVGANGMSLPPLDRWAQDALVAQEISLKTTKASWERWVWWCWVYAFTVLDPIVASSWNQLAMQFVRTHAWPFLAILPAATMSMTCESQLDPRNW